MCCCVLKVDALVGANLDKFRGGGVGVIGQGRRRWWEEAEAMGRDEGLKSGENEGLDVGVFVVDNSVDNVVLGLCIPLLVQRVCLLSCPDWK